MKRNVASAGRSDECSPVEISVEGNDGEHASFGMFAVKDIRKGDEILMEEPFFEQEMGLAFRRPEFLHDNEACQLKEELQIFTDMYSHLPRGHPDRYPPRAREVLDRLCDKGQAHAYEQLSATEKAKYAALEDSFRKITPDTPVILTGLTSEAGRQLNCLSGIASAFDGHRWAVLMPSRSGKKIKPENLKTPGGICRTNSFCFSGKDVLLEQMCRINHSCVPNAMIQQPSNVQFRSYILIARCDIRKGEQIFIDYGVPKGSTEERRDFLRMKYNFTCHCKACTNAM